MRLHLVNDEKMNNSRPKLGLGYISSFLKKYLPGIEISLSFWGDGIVDDITRLDPDIIGFTSTTETFNKVVKKAKFIKDKFNKPLIIGGNHITLLPQELPEWIDIGVIGEGEETILELISNFITKGKLADEGINGIVFWKDGKPITTKERDLIEPMDKIPFPDWDLLSINAEGPGHIMTSRGCPYKCVFCSPSALWKYPRFFSPERVVSEIKHIVETYNRDYMLIYDDLFIADKKRTIEISERICAEGLNKKVRFECLANVNLFTSDIADALRKMNVFRISFGMESGSPEVLNYLKCGKVTHEKIIKAVKLGIDKGFEVLGSFVLGVPCESKDDILMTYNFIKNVGLTEIGVNIATPYPETRLWDDSVKAGYIDGDKWDDSLYCMKTVTPQTIAEKKILSPVDKDIFIALYKMIIDLDSSLIDRRVRLRNLREKTVQILKSKDEKNKRVLDVWCENGTLGAAIKSDSHTEIIGLNPDSESVIDATRRLDAVLTDEKSLLSTQSAENKFDCIIYNDRLGKEKNVKSLLLRHIEYLKDDGKIVISLPNKMHFSKIAYLLFNITRPPFETVDGTHQYGIWGNPDQNISSEITIYELMEILKQLNLNIDEVFTILSNDHSLLNDMKEIVRKNGCDTNEFLERVKPIRYFIVASKLHAQKTIFPQDSFNI